MKKYNCEKCGKYFTQLYRYTTHINKKNLVLLIVKLRTIN